MESKFSEKGSLHLACCSGVTTLQVSHNAVLSMCTRIMFVLSGFDPSGHSMSAKSKQVKYVVSDEEDFEMESAKSSSDSGEEFSISAPKKAAIVCCALLASSSHSQNV